MGTRPKQIGLSMEDFAEFPEEQQETFAKLVNTLNPWLGDVSGAFAGRLTIGDNVSASYKTLRCLIPQVKWTPITTFQNGWQNYGFNSFSTASYTIQPNGLCMLKGLIRSGTTAGGTLIFTLPEGYRPEANRLFTVARDGTPGSCNLDVLLDGRVFVSGASVASAGWTSLDNISFLAVNPAPPEAFDAANWPIIFDPQIPTRPSAVFVAKVVDVNSNAATSLFSAGVDWELTPNNKIKVKRINGLTPGRTYDVTFLTLGT